MEYTMSFMGKPQSELSVILNNLIAKPTKSPDDYRMLAEICKQLSNNITRLESK